MVNCSLMLKAKLDVRGSVSCGKLFHNDEDKAGCERDSCGHVHCNCQV